MINCQTDRLFQTTKKDSQHKYSPMINKNQKSKILINSSNKENASINSSYFRKSTNCGFTSQKDTPVRMLKFNDRSIPKKISKMCQNHHSRKAHYLFENNKCQQAIYFCQMCAITVASKGFSVSKIQQNTANKTFSSHMQDIQVQIFKQALKQIKQQQLNNLLNSKLQLARNISQINIFFMTLHNDIENLKNKMMQQINCQIEKTQEIRVSIEQNLSKALQAFEVVKQTNTLDEISKIRAKISRDIYKTKIGQNLFQIRSTKPIIAYLQTYLDKHSQHQQSTQSSKNPISISEHSEILTFGNDCTEDSALALQSIDFLQNQVKVGDSSTSNMSQFLLQKCAQYHIQQSS